MNEAGAICRPQAEQLGSTLAAYVDLHALLELAETATPPSGPRPEPPLQPPEPRMRIAVARDAAFNFYYNV